MSCPRKHWHPASQGRSKEGTSRRLLSPPDLALVKSLHKPIISIIVTARLKGWLWFHVAPTQGGLRTNYILADPPCVHRKGVTCTSQKELLSVEATQQQGQWLVGSQKPDAEPKKVYDYVEASARSLHWRGIIVSTLACSKVTRRVSTVLE